MNELFYQQFVIKNEIQNKGKHKIEALRWLNKNLGVWLIRVVFS